MNTSFITLIHIVRVFRKLLWKKAVHSSSIFPKIIKFFGKTRQLSNVCRIVFYVCNVWFSADISSSRMETGKFVKHIWSMCPFYIPSENTRKPKVFSCFERVWNGNIGQKLIKGIWRELFPSDCSKSSRNSFLVKHLSMADSDKCWCNSNNKTWKCLYFF